MNKEFERRHNEVLNILALLSEEAKQKGENVVFLGGSAVQAMLEKPKRVSIDLDIYYSGDAKELVRVLNGMGYRVTERPSMDPEMFEFYTAQREDVIVKIDFLKLKIPQEYVTRKGSTSIAKPEYLMAAKLSALAVGATGRKVESERIESDLLKDVFDFNSMVDEFPDLNEKVHAAVSEITRQQNKLRKTSYTVTNVYEAMRKALRGIAQIKADKKSGVWRHAKWGEEFVWGKEKKLFITQGALKNFGEYLFEGRLGRAKIGEGLFGAVGELSRAELSVLAMRALYYSVTIEKKKEAGTVDKIAGEKGADRMFVSECERKLAEAGEDQKWLHELKIIAPRALIYLYYSRFPEV